MEMELERITPEVAKKYLETSPVNRNERRGNHEKLVRDIRAGVFYTNNDAITFDEEGRLLNGHHRLKACIDADTPITVWVLRGMPRKNAGIIDVGAVRSFQDGLVFSDSKEFDAPWFKSTQISGAVRCVFRFGVSRHLYPTPEELKNFYRAFPNQLECLYHASATRKAGGNSAINGAALAALICGEDPDAIHQYFTAFGMIEGINVSEYNVNAAFLWKKQIQSAKLQHKRIEQTKLYLGTQNSIWSFIHAENSKLIRASQNERYTVERILKFALNI